MNSTQREAVARMFAQATGIDNGAAKESVDLFMPRFIKEYDSNVRDFKLDNTKASLRTGSVNIKYPSSPKRLLLNLWTIRTIVNTIAAINKPNAAKVPIKYTNVKSCTPLSKFINNPPNIENTNVTI